PPLPALALPHGLRDVRGGHRLPAARRRGLHQPQRAPSQDPLAARPPGLSVRVDVAVTPDGLDRAAVPTSTVLVVDVLRASTCIVTALANGCAAIVPVATPEEARARLAGRPAAPEAHVCAGLLAERLLAAEPGPDATSAAREAAELARPYGKDVGRLARDSSWARHLASRGRAADVAACLTLDTASVVPVYRADVDKVVAGRG